jgi:hypothetical protein
MGKLLIDHSMSVDGFSTGPNLGVERSRLVVEYDPRREGRAIGRLRSRRNRD